MEDVVDFGQLKSLFSSVIVGNFKRYRKQGNALFPCLDFNADKSPPETISAIALVALDFQEEKYP